MSPARAATVVFGRALLLLAGASAVFLLVNHLQTSGACRPDESADDAFLAAYLITIGGLIALLITAFGQRFRAVRTAALLAWAASLLPAALLLFAARDYLHSLTPGC